jgi:NTP pyrophosphatase (non-canonical NTP hydrolase)
MTTSNDHTDNPALEPANVHALTVLVCQDCIDLKGEMCNNAECVFCRRTMKEVRHYLDVMLLCPVVNGERLVLVGDAVTNDDTRSRAPVAATVNDEAGLQRRLFDECVTAKWDPERRNTFAEEIAHLHEELSEAFRAWRRYKDCEVREVNGKLEGVPIQFADALIGMFYNAELHGFDLLAAVEQKHQFNLKRNYVNEGRQLHAPSPTDNEAVFTSPLTDEEREIMDHELDKAYNTTDNEEAK